MIKKLLHYKKAYKKVREYVEYNLEMYKDLLEHMKEIEQEYGSNEFSRSRINDYKAQIITAKGILNAIDHYEIETL